MTLPEGLPDHGMEAEETLERFSPSEHTTTVVARNRPVRHRNRFPEITKNGNEERAAKRNGVAVDGVAGVGMHKDCVVQPSAKQLVEEVAAEEYACCDMAWK